MSAIELRILKKLKVRDASLIAASQSYNERKTALVAYAAELRALRSSAASAGQVLGDAE